MAEVRFRVLGPVEVSVDGRPLALGATKQRAVLAMLALSPNTVVSADRLMEGLWGEHPPASAPKMVQLYAAVRGGLEEAGLGSCEGTCRGGVAGTMTGGSGVGGGGSVLAYGVLVM